MNNKIYSEKFGLNESQQDSASEEFELLWKYSFILALGGDSLEGILLSVLLIFQIFQQKKDPDAGEDRFMKNILAIETYPQGSQYFLNGLMLFFIAIIEDLFYSSLVSPFITNPRLLFFMSGFIGLGILSWFLVYWEQKSQALFYSVTGFSCFLIIIHFVWIESSPIWSYFEFFGMLETLESINNHLLLQIIKIGLILGINIVALTLYLQMWHKIKSASNP